MTQNEIDEIADKCGLAGYFELNGDSVGKLMIEAFTKMVEEKTRKELREEIVYTWVPPHFVNLAVEAEREACARVCDDIGMFHKVPQGADLCFALSRAIRARSKT